VVEADEAKGMEVWFLVFVQFQLQAVLQCLIRVIDLLNVEIVIGGDDYRLVQFLKKPEQRISG